MRRRLLICAVCVCAGLSSVSTTLADDGWARRLLWTPETLVTTALQLSTADGFTIFTTGGTPAGGGGYIWDAGHDFWIHVPWTSGAPAEIAITLRTSPHGLSPLTAEGAGDPLQTAWSALEQWWLSYQVSVFLNEALVASFVVTPRTNTIRVALPAGALLAPTPLPSYTNDKLVNHVRLTIAPWGGRTTTKPTAGIQGPWPQFEIHDITVTMGELFARIGDEHRRAVVVTTPSALSVPVAVPHEGARLSVGFGLPEECRQAAPPLRFAVSVNGQERYAFTAMSPLEDLPGWGDAEMDLSPYAGQTVLVQFTVTTSGQGRTGYALWALPVMYRPKQGADPTRWPNVLLITVDAMRADHVSASGYHRATTPLLDQLAAHGVLCQLAIAQSSWTMTSIASLLTGLYPMRHGMIPSLSRLDERLETLPERFRRAGYVTAVSQTNQWLHTQFGFCQGVDRYHFDPGSSPAHPIRADAQLGYVRRWFDQFRQQPFFVWVHFIEVHAPYGGFIPPPEIDRFGPTNVDHYDAAIRMIDDRIRSLVTTLDALDLRTRTIIVISADHGEEFGEHGGKEHGRTLYQDQIHVPLILSWPAGLPKGRMLEGPVEHVDLFPTLVELAGLPPSVVDGRSLVPLIQQQPGVSFRPAFSRTGHLLPTRLDLFSIITPDHWKYIEDRQKGTAALYDLASDPMEQHDKSAQEPQRLRRLRQALAAWRSLRPAGTPQAVALNHEATERLRALGYLQ